MNTLESNYPPIKKIKKTGIYTQPPVLAGCVDGGKPLCLSEPQSSPAGWKAQRFRVRKPSSGISLQGDLGQVTHVCSGLQLSLLITQSDDYYPLREDDPHSVLSAVADTCHYHHHPHHGMALWP